MIHVIRINIRDFPDLRSNLPTQIHKQLNFLVPPRFNLDDISVFEEELKKQSEQFRQKTRKQRLGKGDAVLKVIEWVQNFAKERSLISTDIYPISIYY